MTIDTRCRLLHDEWEHGIKPHFDGQRDRKWTFNLPWECLDREHMTPGVSLPSVTITSAEVRAAFDSTTTKIYAMIQQQITAVKARKGKDPKVMSFPPPSPPQQDGFMYMLTAKHST
jgi:hypothetical protein